MGYENNTDDEVEETQDESLYQQYVATKGNESNQHSKNVSISMIDKGLTMDQATSIGYVQNVREWNGDRNRSDTDNSIVFHQQLTEQYNKGNVTKGGHQYILEDVSDSE